MGKAREGCRNPARVSRSVFRLASVPGAPFTRSPRAEAVLERVVARFFQRRVYRSGLLLRPRRSNNFPCPALVTYYEIPLASSVSLAPFGFGHGVSLFRLLVWK